MLICIKLPCCKTYMYGVLNWILPCVVYVSVDIQWNLGIRDTQGTVKTVLNSEVVLFLRSISM